MLTFELRIEILKTCVRNMQSEKLRPMARTEPLLTISGCLFKCSFPPQADGILKVIMGL
jgi:hypothetical protein